MALPLVHQNSPEGEPPGVLALGLSKPGAFQGSPLVFKGLPCSVGFWSLLLWRNPDKQRSDKCCRSP